MPFHQRADRQVLNYWGIEEMKVTRDEVAIQISGSVECWLYSPSSLNALWGWSPEEGELPRESIALAKMNNQGWLLACFQAGPDRVEVATRLFLCRNGETSEIDGSIVRQESFSIPADSRLKKHPYVRKAFWKKIYDKSKGRAGVSHHVSC
jgi:hypothetical protein